MENSSGKLVPLSMTACGSIKAPLSFKASAFSIAALMGDNQGNGDNADADGGMGGSSSNSSRSSSRLSQASGSFDADDDVISTSNLPPPTLQLEGIISPFSKLSSLTTYLAQIIGLKINKGNIILNTVTSFFHSGYFYSASSSPLLLRDAPDTARILCRNFMPKRHRQLRVKDLPKVPIRGG